MRCASTHPRQQTVGDGKSAGDAGLTASTCNLHGISISPPSTDRPVRRTMNPSNKRERPAHTNEGFEMKKIIGSALIGTGLAAAALSLATPASAADSAVITIGQLEAQGFDVKLDRVGSAPLNQCVVTDVRNPRERTELVRTIGGGDRDFVPVVVKRTVTVSLDCSRR